MMPAQSVGMQMQCNLQAGSRRVATINCSTFISIKRQKEQLLCARPTGIRGGRMCSSSVQASAAQTAPGKLISRVEIPAFIPRSDIMDQLYRWALIEVQEAGVANLGCPAKVTPYTHEGVNWGFTVSFMKDGVSATDVRVAFDEDVTYKHEWVGRGADGFPVLEGNAEEVQGKYFEIRKTDEHPVTEPIRASIREFCTMLVGAINKYYAFGSCFVDDST